MEEEQVEAPVVQRKVCQPRSRMARLVGSQLDQFKAEQEREKERLELERLEREFDEQMELAEKVEREDGEEADPPATEPQGSLGGTEGVRGGRAETGWQGRGTKWKEGTESTFRL